MGKNTLLLHPEGGSYFLIGEIFLTLELAGKDRISDLCGSCSLCLEACPTGALDEAYRLDSRRCLSYWSIEHRGDLPAQVSSWMHEWIFGCDACQSVCPWNAAVDAANHPELLLPEHRRQLKLRDLLPLAREDWVELFRKSPIKRAKLEGMKRNVAAVLGHRGAKGDREALIGALASRHAQVRIEAVRALGRLGGASARESLEALMEHEADNEVRIEAERALTLC